MRSRRVLALELTSTTAGFVVLEGPERLVIWGSKGIDDDVSRFLPKLSREVLRYRPDVIVGEDPALSRKGSRVREHLVWCEQWSADHETPFISVSAGELRSWSEHLGPTKERRAIALARLFPEIRPLVPPPRKLWQAEAKRVNVFVALSRALYYYERSERGL